MISLRRKSSRAFTLIELLIVCSLVSIITASTFAFVTHFQSTGDRLTQRLNAAEAADRALTLWRIDVAAAIGTDVADDGMAVTIHRLDAQGDEVEVYYSMDGAGRLMRSVAGVAEPLVTDIENLSFARPGGCYRARWETTFFDGTQTWRWHKAGLATPLNPTRGRS